MTIVVTRTGKGAEITQSENDGNLDSLAGINEAQVGAYTIVAADQNRTIECSNAGTTVITLTLISTIIAAIDTSDFKVTIKNIGAGALTLTPTTDTFDDGDATKSLAQYEWMTIQTDSTEGLWNIIGSSDASKVDGLDSSQFLRSDANDTTTGNLTISNAAPSLALNESDGGLDQKQWKIYANGEALQATITDDADANATAWLLVQRSGTGASVTIDSVTLLGTDINLSVNFK